MDGEETLDIEKQDSVQNLNSSQTENCQVPEKLLKESTNTSYLTTTNNMVTKKENGENVDTIISKSSQKLEGSNQKLASTPKQPSMTDSPLLRQQAVDVTTSGNGLSRDSILASPQKSVFQ